ncbi:MAG: NAD(P)H-binding protein [Deltaproteobacteria bacterium]|nr:NAD(P)H-binding protein [Deltaproteobacteria bacterium]
MPTAPGTILLAGATGFVGRNLYPALCAAGYVVRCGSRDPDSARRKHPDRDWVRFDADLPRSVPAALAGTKAAIYLVHHLAAAGDYEAHEERAAVGLSVAAAAAGVERIVYLGGVLPRGRASKHLRSRLHTGLVLRSGPTPTFELRASMIVGAGSDSFELAKEISTRAPVLLFPDWLASRSQPVAIADVVVAILTALRLPTAAGGVYALPGPETLSAREILRRIARAAGNHPPALRLPFLPRSVAGQLVARLARRTPAVGRELALGLGTDLTAADDGIFALLPDHVRQPFDDAVRQALCAPSYL